MRFVQSYSDQCSSMCVGMVLVPETPVGRPVTSLHNIAQENQMAVEWTYFNEDVSPKAGEPFVVTSLRHDGDPEGKQIKLSVCLPSWAYELCEALWGPPRSIGCQDTWEIEEL